ncbi:hypothetical protein [Bartonella tamiae]|uniref:Uncharacterized protein n=1 Tax=Bartonella tamiae Th239 TaxID=1094558 RepID=J0QXB5_9HYPH|nr:hypothetical protein [Bartonella tamiae]EJF90691.1 hypothetical protein ME5_01092 [Bartonella tamiae Th239]EJF93932.1 hypothetical protein MEG_00790 [Bartonella tamiae Th307]
MKKLLFSKVSRRAALSFFMIYSGVASLSYTANAADMILTFEPAHVSTGVCAHQHVLSNVSYKFYHAVRHIPDIPIVRIKDMANIVMTRDEPAATKLNISRQYCGATAIMNDGSTYPIWYMVEFGQGFTGVGGFNTEFCVEGFDKWRIQDGNCRAVR